MYLKVCLLATLVKEITGVIYDLNETEYSRMPPIFHLEQYRPCLQDSHGMYCTLRLDLYADPYNELMNIIQEYSELKTKHYNHSFVEWGVCVSKSCYHHLVSIDLENREDLEQALEKCLDQAIESKYGVHAKLGKIYNCERSDKPRTIDLYELITLVLVLGVIALNVVGTLNQQKNNRFLSCFSLSQNWKTLIKQENPKELKGINGLKSVSSLFTTAFHALWLNGVFINYPRYFEQAYDDLMVKFIASNYVSVQIFFVMSGVLLTYSLLCSEEKKPLIWKQLPERVLSRWSRLTPSYAISILLCATWLPRLSGAISSLVLSGRIAPDCRKYFWHHVFYVNNYTPGAVDCAVHSWYISVDFQLFLVGIIIFISTQTHRMRCIMLLILVGVLLPALHVWMWDLEALQLATPEFLRTFSTPTFHYSHVLAHNNASCYALGMATGYLIHRWKKTGVDLTQSKLARILSWLVIPLIIANFSLSTIFFELESISANYRMLYAAVHRLMYGVVCAVAIVCVAFDVPFFIVELLRWPGWAIPSRLSYNIYLNHAIVLYLLLGIREQLHTTANKLQSLFISTSVIVLSILLAMLFYLMIEEPFNRLMRIYLDRSKLPSVKKQKTN